MNSGGVPVPTIPGHAIPGTAMPGTEVYHSHAVDGRGGGPGGPDPRAPGTRLPGTARAGTEVPGSAIGSPLKRQYVPATARAAVAPAAGGVTVVGRVNPPCAAVDDGDAV